MHSFEEYRDIINNKLTDYIPNIAIEADVIKESMVYSLTIGGKRLRPVLLLASCEFAGGDIEKALPFACAIEYIHTYSLIHDDLPAMDNDDLRRGQATNHIKYGEDIAILAGDSLLNTSAEIMLKEIVNHSNSQESLQRYSLAAYEIMNRAGIQGMIAGQVADVVNQYDNCSSELVDYIEKNKTGQLIVAPIVAGLIIAGADDTTIDAFKKYAECLGKAFQVVDDILDFEGDSDSLGKSVGKDKDLGKCNYVCIHGLEEAKKELSKLSNTAKSSISKYGRDAEFFINLVDVMGTRNS